MYGWAPLAIMGEEINKLESSGDGPAYSRVSQDGNVETGRSSEDLMQIPVLGNNTHRPEEMSRAGGDMAGVYLGIWNIFAVIPQFLATFISMIAFSILEPGKSPELSDGDEGPGDDASKRLTQGLSGTAVCLAIGAVCSFIAATQTFRMRKM